MLRLIVVHTVAYRAVWFGYKKYCSPIQMSSSWYVPLCTGQGSSEGNIEFHMMINIYCN